MSEKPSTYIGLACAALVLAGFVPGISDAAAGLGAGRQADEISTAGRPSSKGDLLTAWQPVARGEVSSIRIEGQHASVSMRTRAGLLVYQADSAAGLSVAAKNIVLPPTPDQMASPAAAPTVVTQNPAAAVSAPAKSDLRKPPIGCERLVSVLVKSAERNRVGLCLA
jgi:hypothetical protein